jgi:hypothetical protein
MRDRSEKDGLKGVRKVTMHEGLCLDRVEIKRRDFQLRRLEE